MTNRLRSKAFGKINLMLDIEGVREDGYHLLRTVMQTVSVYDMLDITVCDNDKFEIEIICSKPDFPLGKDNLIYKAADSFFEYTKIDNKKKITVKVEKNLPSMAGMGGGSADCAAVLKMLDEMFDTGLSFKELCGIGVKLGADVPFCLAGGTRLCKGIGEKMTLLNSPECAFLIIKPDVSVSTPEAFKKYDSIEDPYKCDLENFLSALENNNLDGLCVNMFNALEYASDLPEIRKAKADLMQSGAIGTLMTGSGSAVFGVFENSDKAESAADKIRGYAYKEVCVPVSSEENAEFIRV